MDKNTFHEPYERHPSRRQPLGDTTAWVNNHHTSTPGPSEAFKSSPPTIPHHESLKPEGNLTVRNSTASSVPAPSVENKRLSTIANEIQTNSNRNSAISTTSTASGKSRRKTHVGPWQLGKTLGKGATGRVRLAKHALTGQSAAIKIVSKKSAAMVQSASMAAMEKNADIPQTASRGRAMPFGIEREVVIMKLIDHPNIISLYDVWENRGELYLVLEYVSGGELFDYVSCWGALPEEEAVRLFRQIIAGLSYCHRYNICHRDLKPENILLDENRNIKLADFGMAALQPAGHWLNTSCGSPHYASPEIIYGRKYLGSRADIWSVGIILFAMLCGFLPFDGGDVSATLKMVKKGEYFLPPSLSREAGDLIQRILQKRPEERIDMEGIWAHPLMKKYEKRHMKSSPYGSLVGPPPPLSPADCGTPIEKRVDIDGELLRNLQTLWHGVKQEVLIEHLLNDELNHQKIFYTSLLKFREDQLENYPGPPLEYSASDYHHISRPPPKVAAKGKAQARNHNQRRSQFSVLNEEEGGTRDSYYKDPNTAQTVESYDPYRSSRNPIVNPHVEYANVTILRQSSNASRSRPGSHTANLRHPAVSRLQAEEGGSSGSSSVDLLHANQFNRESARTSQSRSSLASSRRAVSPVPVRRSSSYKRHVSFHHLRQRSAGRAKFSPSQFSFDQETEDRPSSRLGTNQLASERYSSPALPTPPPTVRPRKPNVTAEDLDIRKARAASHYWKDEARKVSAELGKICEEAFNRSSVSPMVRKAYSYEASPPSSSTHQNSAIRTQNNHAVNRPLPEPPAESLEARTLRMLAETRRRLIEQSNTTGRPEGSRYLDNVIAHLDRLIQLQRGNADDTENGRRAASDPTPHSFVDSAYLAATTAAMAEERSVSGNDDIHQPLSRGRESQNQRVVSDPVSGRLPTTRASYQQDKKTIRMVPQDELPPIEPVRPLTIRKKSSQEPSSLRGGSTDTLGSSYRAHLTPNEDFISDYPRQNALDKACDSGFDSHYHHSGLEPIQENPKSPGRRGIMGSGDSKKWSWLGGRRRHTANSDERPPTPPRKDTMMNFQEAIASEPSTSPKGKQPVYETSPVKKFSGSGGKARFLKFFGMDKKTAPKPPKPANVFTVGGTDTDDTDSIASSAVGPSDILNHVAFNSQHRPDMPIRNIEVDQNWFIRFLNIKPATRVICLRVTKTKARAKLVKVLKNWKRYGLQDVTVDKAKDLIFGRVDPTNYLHLKSVEFVGELFAVLEYGRRANLSMVRFTQQRGAASSFYKVVDTLQLVLKEHNLLVPDPRRAKNMAKVLA